MTDVLAHLDLPVGGYDGLTDGLGSELSQALEQLTPPRSIAELRLSADDFRKLDDWALTLRPEVAGQWMHSFQKASNGSSRAAVIGLVTLAFIAEIARRETWDGSIWPVVRRHFRESTVDALFIQGQPNELLKDALQIAANQFSLRNVFGLDGTQAWYLSSFLQFGMTRRSIHAHLPRRLSGHEALPRAVELLLHDSELQSESFESLWRALESYRADNLSERNVRRKMQSSPWVLPEWEDDLVKGAKALKHLHRARGVTNPDFIDDIEETSPALLSQPLLVWDGPIATFSFDVVGLADLDLDTGTYVVTVDGERHPFINTSEGPQGLETIRLPIDRPSTMTSLKKRNEQTEEDEVVLQSEVTVWEIEDEVALFDADGNALDAWSTRMDLSKSYSLLLAPDLDFEGPSTRRHQMPSGVKAIRIEPSADTSLVVRLEGELLWEPLPTRIRERDSFEQQVDVSIPGSWDGIELGQAVRVEIRHLPEEASVTSLSVAGSRTTSFRSKDGTVKSPRVQLDPNRAGRRIPVLMRGRYKTRPFAIRKSIAPPWVGCQVLTEEGWMSTEGALTQRRSIEGRTLRVFIPTALKSPPDRRPTIFGGNRVLGVGIEGARVVHGIAGYGEPLIVRSDRFNDPDEIFMVARAISDGGVIAASDLSEPELVTLQLGPTSRVNDRWQVFTVDGRGSIERADFEQSSNGLNVLGPSSTIAWLATVGESIIGSSWRRTLSSDELTTDEARNLAILLRAGKAPILNEGRLRNRVVELIQRHPWAFLEAWTMEIESPFGERLVVEEAWASASRELLAEWSPGDHAGDWLDSMLGRFDGPETLRRIGSLGRAFPLPFGRLVPYLGPEEHAQLRGLILGTGSLSEIAQDVAQRLRVDSGFIEGLGREAKKAFATNHRLPGPVRTNIAIAANTEPDFRRWLAGSLIPE